MLLLGLALQVVAAGEVTMIDYRWFTVAGLVSDILGASIIAIGVITSKKGAVESGVGRFAGSTPEENLRLPAVVDRLRQSTLAKWGLALLVLGFVLQLVGSWPR